MGRRRRRDRASKKPSFRPVPPPTDADDRLDVKQPVSAMDAWSPKAWRATVTGACLAAALVATWPLALHPTSAIPTGTETAATIPVFDVWTLWWNADRLAHAYAGLWDAPIFHPTQGTFTFSEPLLLPGAVAAPLFWLRAPPALAHNVVLLAILCVDGILGCRLARALGIVRLPALLAGILVVALPFFAKMQGELPVLAIGGTLAAIDGIVRFAGDGRTRHAIAAAGGIVAQALSCQQFALFSLLFIGAAAVVALAERGFAQSSVVRLAASLSIACGVVYAIARVSLRVHEELGFSRAADLVQSLSAKPLDYVIRPATALLPFPPREDPSAYTEGLFPGLLLVGLALLGALTPWLDDRQKRWRWYAIGSSVFALVLSFGLNVSIGSWQPFATLRALPGFAEVRSAYRCAVFVQIHLVLLAAFGLATLRRRLPQSWRRPQALAVAVGLGAAMENLSVPVPLLTLPDGSRAPWVAHLAEQPPETVIAHIPFPRGGSVEQLAPEAWRMLAQVEHRQPLVNGYSSNFPPVYREFMFAMGSQFPQPMLACALKRVFGADLLVVDQDWLTSHQPGFAAITPMLDPSYSDSSVAMYRLRPSDAECPPMRVDIGSK